MIAMRKIEKIEEVKKWMQELQPQTAKLYHYKFIVYWKWAGLNPKQLIDEAEDDFKKPARERGAVKKRLLEYYKYLSTDYVYIRKPPTKKTTKKGREPSINTVSGVYISGSNRFYFH
jgi:hypothetical protein